MKFGQSIKDEVSQNEVEFTSNAMKCTLHTH